jgi:hypothetical protein
MGINAHDASQAWENGCQGNGIGKPSTPGVYVEKGVTPVTLLIIRYLGCYIGCYRGVTGVLLVTPPLYRNSHFSSMLRAGAGIGTANYLAKKAKYLNQHKNKNL